MTINIGDIFDRLTVIELIDSKHALCKCICGNIKKVSKSNLRGKGVRSCGCLSEGRKFFRNRKHGYNGTSIYQAWSDMKKRCYKQDNSYYKNYGGRGIIVCEEWKNSFERFLADVGDKPFPKAQLDRIDNDGNYCKENCRWVTCKENQRNKRDTMMLTYLNITAPLTKWCEDLGFNYDKVRSRLRYTKEIEQALFIFADKGG